MFAAFVDFPNPKMISTNLPVEHRLVPGNATGLSAMQVLRSQYRRSQPLPTTASVLLTQNLVDDRERTRHPVGEETSNHVQDSNSPHDHVAQNNSSNPSPATRIDSENSEASTEAAADTTETLVEPIQTPADTAEGLVDADPEFEVKQIQILGNTQFSNAELQVYTKPLEGRRITLSDLRQAVTAITQLYLSQGYVNSRAILGKQAIVDGQVTIQVIEGSVETIQVEGNQRLPDSYIINRLRRGVESPLRSDRLESQLRLLQIDPALASIEASLRPGSRPDQSRLIIRVKEAKPAYFGITSDNYSPPIFGSERYGIYGGLRSTFVPGDELFTSYNRSTSGGSNLLGFFYRAPVNPMNGTIQLRIEPSWYKVTDREIGSLFDISGNSQLYELTYRQPVVRNFRNEIALSLGFALRNGTNKVGGSSVFDTDRRIRVLKFGQDFLARDPQGVWSGQSSFNIGLNLFNATDNPEPFADGQFFSWSGGVQRIQRFNASNVLIAQLNLQFSTDPLLPSQQFAIGGAQSVRGYRQDARFGDNGIRFSLEHRTVVARNRRGRAIAQIAPFLDLGTVWNVPSNPVATPNQRFLSGAGLGLILQPLPALNMRFDYAIPFRRVDEKNTNLQDQAFYFSLGYQP